MFANAVNRPGRAHGANVIRGEVIVVVARHPGIGLVNVLAGSGAFVALWHLAVFEVAVDAVFETRREYAAAVLNKLAVAVVVERAAISAAALGDWAVVGDLECVKPIKRVGAEKKIAGELDSAIHRLQRREQGIKGTRERCILDDHPKAT